jgi:drug/metabolite transporter (DMT)-like permease
MTYSRNQLSPTAGILIGALFAIVGAVVIVAAYRGALVTEAGDPPWLAPAAGAVFILAGAAVINGFVIAGGATAGGDLPPGTPMSVRVVQYLLGLGIVGPMTLIFGWIAFGPGTRRFRVSGIPIPGLDGETAGRIVFGVGAVLLGAFLVAMAVVGARRLLRARIETPMNRE